MDVMESLEIWWELNTPHSLLCTLLSTVAPFSIALIWGEDCICNCPSDCPITAAAVQLFYRLLLCVQLPESRS